MAIGVAIPVVVDLLLRLESVDLDGDWGIVSQSLL